MMTDFEQVVAETLLLSDVATKLWGTPVDKLLAQLAALDYTVNLSEKKIVHPLDEVEWTGQLYYYGEEVKKFTSHYLNGDYMIVCDMIVWIGLNDERYKK